jgi:hypothetical protein
MKSVVVKRSVVISGHKTGVSLEDEMSAKSTSGHGRCFNPHRSLRPYRVLC